MRQRRLPLTLAVHVILAVATLAGACGGSSSPTAPSTTAPPAPAPPPAPSPPVTLVPASPTTSEMLQGLDAYIARALAENQAALPRNPQNAAQLQAKIAMLQNPSLASELVATSRWAQSSGAASISVVFPLESMRAEAQQAVQVLETALRHLGEFLGLPFPSPSVKVWYGFVIGNSGGGGFIFSEDRGTYDGRTGGRFAPYDAILAHELGHSYVGNESLTQVLEMYAYNRALGAGADPATWTWTRSWVPNSPSNQDSAAVLDVLQLVGLDATVRGYRAVIPLRPPYGSALSPAVIQAFSAQAPSGMRAQVEQKLGRVTF